MAITSDKLKDLMLVDEVIPEPNGGVHRDFNRVCAMLKVAVEAQLASLKQLAPDDLVEKRYNKLLRVGIFKDG